MNKRNQVIHSILFSTLILSCNNNTVTKEEETLNKDSIQTTMDTTSIATTYVNTTPLEREDSNFVMEAAMDGRMEAEFANFAQVR